MSLFLSSEAVSSRLLEAAGLLCYKQDQFSEAEGYFEQLVSLEPDDLVAGFYLGVIQSRDETNPSGRLIKTGVRRAATARLPLGLKYVIGSRDLLIAERKLRVTGRAFSDHEFAAPGDRL